MKRKSLEDERLKINTDEKLNTTTDENDSIIHKSLWKCNNYRKQDTSYIFFKQPMKREFLQSDSQQQKPFYNKWNYKSHQQLFLLVLILKTGILCCGYLRNLSEPLCICKTVQCPQKGSDGIFIIINICFGLSCQGKSRFFFDCQIAVPWCHC